jgi:branched-chain amino acid transport system permease protein
VRSAQIAMKHLISSRNCLFVLYAVLAALPMIANLYLTFIGNLILIYIVLSLGLNLLIGNAGQFALAHAAMYGIGAYATGLLQVDLGVPYFMAAPAGALAASAIGTLLALPALRLSGIYLALATLAFAQAAVWVFGHWDAVTHGAAGFSIPPVDFAPLPLRPELGMYYLSWLVAVLLLVFAWNLVRSRLGRALIAMRDNDVAAQALGINLLRYKAIAFALSGFYAGAAGALYAGVLNFVSPEGFGLFQLMIIQAMIVVGGLGYVAGSVFGAVLLVVLLEAVRDLPSLQEVAFGLVLLAFMLLLPQGLVGTLSRWIPGWHEPRHVSKAVARRTLTTPESVEAQR